MVAAEPTVAVDEGAEVEPSFSDNECGETDSISDEELVGDILRKRPQESEYEHCCIIVSGIPVVGEDRLPKLKNVLGKLFSRIHQHYNDAYPLDKDNKTKGYCFVEYPTAEVAENATAILEGYVLDKNHTFSVNIFLDLHKFEEPDPNWKAPTARPYTDFGDLWWWLQNEKCYDQFAIHYEREATKTGGGMTSYVGVYEFRKGQDPVLAGSNAERETWTVSFFKWSPSGTYLATVHSMGIALWAGENFTRFMRMQHEYVMMFDFSPHERFVVTYALPEGRWDDRHNLRIFEVQTGELRKGFSSMHLQRDNNCLSCWPYFQWSCDEKYVACLKPAGNGISVYETETFTLLDKKPITIDGLRSFQWSPTRPVIAYYCEERTSESAPAEIGLMEIPSKVKLRAQRIFSVSDVELFWNKNGDRLAAHTERYQKKNIKSSAAGVEDVKYSKPTSHIEIFDAREKEVSVLSMQLSESYVSFGWEPSGDKFCVLVGTQHKSTPLIYVLDSSKHIPQLISKFEPNERFTNVSWAPAGGWLVVYSANTTSGAIMFIDSNGAEPTRTMLVEYPGFSKGCWDPTGRYFAAVYTTGGGKGGDTGYRIFTFQGKELFRKNLERLQQFKWRPRLPIKLSDEKIKLIRKNLKATSAKFEEEDKRERGRASQEVVAKRRKIMDEFKKIRAKHITSHEQEAQLRIELRGGMDTTVVAMDDLVEETITVPLTTEKIKLQDATIEEE